MRLGLVSDVHLGPPATKDGKLRKLSGAARRLTDDFVEDMRSRARPDVVVNLGDVVEDEGPGVDRSRYGEFVAALSRLRAPVVHVAGNHDLVHLTEPDLAALWAHDGPLYYAREVAGVNLVVLLTRETAGVDVRLDETQLRWLVEALRASCAPAVVLMHHPASEMRLAGNRWFERAPQLCRVVERRRLRTILESSGRVLAVFNGHAHWNHLDVIAGIPYVTLQSLTENVEEDAPGRPAGAWAVADVERGRVVVEVAGAEPARYQIERR